MKNQAFEKWWNSYYHQSNISVSVKKDILLAFEAGYEAKMQDNKPLHSDIKNSETCCNNPTPNYYGDRCLNCGGLI